MLFICCVALNDNQLNKAFVVNNQDKAQSGYTPQYYRDVLMGVGIVQGLALVSYIFWSVEAIDFNFENALKKLAESEQQWMTKDQILNLISNNVRFRDITDFEDTDTLAKQNAGSFSFPSALSHQKQPSVIARIDGSEKPDEILVVSAHQDSINIDSPVNGRAPGADDDGSGSVTILETLRVLYSSGLCPKRSVEFHWYAGEEGGLLGSADVSKAYADKTVVADLHFDMTGYPMDPPAVGIVTDYTDADMNRFLRMIVKGYTDLPTKDFQCGYACSDHASWHERGVKSALPFENQYVDGNQNIHTTNDTIDTVDFNHLLKFVKIALGFIIEVSDAT
ncbi:hypothetical protein H4R99_001171 [Coemansia sp. RSA 1722]|nr:hypothetical protein H4R99_001171 [Coemansia sp. RSA 1722]